MVYESNTTCPSHNTSFIEHDEHYTLQDHNKPIPGPSEYTLQDHDTPILLTNSPKHKQAAKQSCILLSATNS